MSENIRDKIKAYLNGKMTGEERSDFETAIQADEHLEAEVEMMRLEKAMLAVKREDRLRQNMKDWDTAYQARKTQRFRIIRMLVFGGLIVSIPMVVYRIFFYEPDVIPAPSTIPAVPSGDTVATTPQIDTGKTQQASTDRALRLAWLGHAVSGQAANLNTLSSSDSWQSALIEKKYQKAWNLLKPEVSNTSGYDPPEAFYFAALLKLYWNPAIEIHADKILTEITYESLATSLPELSQTELELHRAIARNPVAMDSLIKGYHGWNKPK